MDELGRVIANLMNSMPGGGTDGAEPSAPPDGTSEPFATAGMDATETGAGMTEGGNPEGGSDGDLRHCSPASEAGTSWKCSAPWAAVCRLIIIKCSSCLH